MNKKIIHTVFENCVESYPSYIALEDSNRKVTYNELNEQSNKLAWLLRDLDVKRGDVVGVMTSSDINRITSLISVFKSGGVYLPLDYSLANDRFEQMIVDTALTILVTTNLENVKDRLASVSHQIQYIIEVDYTASWKMYKYDTDEVESLNTESLSTNNLDLINEADDANYIFYTSGSTGKAKAILGAHKSLSHFIHWEMKEFDVSNTIKVSHLTSPMFDASLRDIFVPLCSGGTLVIPDNSTKQTIPKLLEWIEEKEINLLHCVPSMFRLMIKDLDPKYMFDKLKYILMAGEKLYTSDVEKWRAVAGNKTELVNLYGASETTLVKTFYRIPNQLELSNQNISIGKPISNTQIIIVSGTNLASIGEIGEIYIKTPFLSKGYFNNPQLTKKVFVPNPLTGDENDLVYRTGDLGKYKADRTIEFLGRQDHQIKLNGVRIELEEIESSVQGYEKIDDAVVISKETDDHSLEIICYYTGDECSNEELNQYLKLKLNSYAVPSFFIKLEELPYNINGKVDRKKLPNPNLQLLKDEIIGPETETQERLQTIFKESLGLEEISIKSSFFQLGGSSLKAIQAISKIFKEFDLLIKLADLFQFPSIETLAQYVDEQLKSDDLSYVSIPEIEESEFYPVSHSQKRLWVLDQFEEDMTAYNISSVLVLEGRLDEDAFIEAYRSLIERHEILRTVFHSVDNTPMQKINSDTILDFEILDMRQELDKNVDKQINDIVGQAFHLENGPLIRARLIRTNDTTYQFVFVMHHIISDNWSMNVLSRDFIKFYNNIVMEQKESVNDLRIQYKDYAAWQNESMQSTMFKKQSEFWNKKFDGELPVLNLPYDYSRPVVQTFNGKSELYGVPKDVEKALRSYCNNNETTLFQSLFALVNIMLHKYSGQNDIITGTSTAGRFHDDLEEQIGCYINTIALRTQLDPNISFNEYVRSIKSMILEAFEHESYPFDLLIDELNLERDLSRSPLFDVLIEFQNVDLRSNFENTLSGLDLTQKEFDQNISKYDINFNFVEDQSGLLLEITYNTDLFKEDTIERMVRNLFHLCAFAVSHEESSIASLELIRKEELKVLDEFHGEVKPFSTKETFVDIFQSHVTKTPDNIALEYKNETYTYKELDLLSDQYAHYFNANYNLSLEDKVCIMIDRSPEMMGLILALWKLGLVYIPLDLEFPLERIKECVNNSESKLLITYERSDKYGVLSEDSSLRDIILSMEKLTLEKDSYRTPFTKKSIVQDSLSYVIYTSGSTGKPKGAMVEHKGMLNHLYSKVDELKLTAKSCIAQNASHCFDISIWQFFSALMVGGKTIIYGNNDVLEPLNFVNQLRKDKVTILELVPSYVSTLLSLLQTKKVNNDIFTHLEFLLVTGEVVKKDVIKRWFSFTPNIPVVNAYGPTEASDDITHAVMHTLPDQEMIPIGKAIQNTSIYIVDSLFNRVPLGAVGEIVVSGIAVGRGYLNDSEKTKKAFLTNPFNTLGERLYRTGDLGRFLPDGEIEFLGRIDNQVKIRGYRIELGEVENSLASLSDIEENVVMVKQSHSDEAVLCAYVKCRNQMTTETIKEALSDLLPTYMIPSIYIFVDEFKTTVNGKLDRSSLPEPDLTAVEKTYIEPRNIQEEKIERIIASILGLEKVSLHDNFFDIGGQSLKSIQLVAHLQEMFNVEMTLKDVFTNNTIATLSEFIHTANPLDNAGMEILPEQEFYDTSYAQKRLWLEHKIEPESTTYNQPITFKINGKVDFNALQHAFNCTIDRHEILRTTFIEIDGDPKQKIHKRKDLSLELNQKHVATWAEIDSQIMSDSEILFNFVDGPLLIGTLYSKSDSEHCLNIVMHHIITDALSDQIFITEIMNSYREYSEKGRLPERRSLEIQYKEYAYWHKKVLENNAKSGKEFWLNNLSGENLTLDLPYDSPENVANHFPKTGVVNTTLPIETFNLVSKISAENGATLFMTMLASVNTLMSWYTGDNTFSIGTPISGRNHSKLKDQIGFYLNMLPIKVSISEEQNFLAVLKETMRATLDSFQYSEYPYNLMVSDLRTYSGYENNQLFNVGFTWDESGVHQMNNDLGGLEIEIYGKKSNTLKSDLWFEMKRVDSEVNLNIIYNADLFDEQTILEMKDFYLKFLEQLDMNLIRPICEIETENAQIAFDDTVNF